MISVVVATHGSDRWRQLADRRAVPSTYGQDGIAEVIASHADDPSATVAQVRNEAAAMATQPWLLFLDGDDELAQGFGAAMVEALAWYDPARASTKLFTPAVQYLAGRQRPKPRIWPRVDLRDGNWLVIGTLVARDLFHRVGGFRDWPIYEDWCLWQRCERAGAEVVEVPDAVYVAHVAANSRNRGPSRAFKLETHDRIRRANYPELYEEEGSR